MVILWPVCVRRVVIVLVQWHVLKLRRDLQRWFIFSSQ